ncbi:MAG TPA: hypothetical protein VFE50_19725 [Cyclobacteriaceae bacterium]|nr:hypothetical protein [Cyclobacteriaceae bacterium]
MRISLLGTFFLTSTLCSAQIDSTLFKRQPVDTTARRAMNMDAVYNRPFLQIGKMPVSIGGYVEAHYQYVGENGISEGHSFSIPRMTLFVASSINRKIRFLSEIELEEGGKEISIEFAAVDFNLHPLANFRGGVIMNPIGAFNQNHDGPKWEFINRPVAMTQMLPATWSNVGAGMYGRQYIGPWAFGYEVYLTNGFDDAIVSNNLNKTFLPASKVNRERFEESSNGKLLLTGKTAIRYAKVGEIGLSYMGGVYNKFQDDGLKLDDQRRVDVWAIDFNTTLPMLKTYIVGEYAFVRVDVGDHYGQQFGEKQGGGFVDIVQPVYRLNRGVFNVAVRLETVDWNKGRFVETNTKIGDEFRAIVPGISYRPTQQTVIRLNYRYEKQWDLFGNPPSKSGGIQIGLSSYF